MKSPGVAVGVFKFLQDQVLWQKGFGKSDPPLEGLRRVAEGRDSYRSNFTVSRAKSKGS
jgi:hypothetical protein